mgnify:FL=1
MYPLMLALFRRSCGISFDGACRRALDFSSDLQSNPLASTYCGGQFRNASSCVNVFASHGRIFRPAPLDDSISFTGPEAEASLIDPL